jgi:NADH-quinone oxidoreductase subunit K
MLSIFVITVAAVEVALGLALVIAIHRRRQTVEVTDLTTMKG